MMRDGPKVNARDNAGQTPLHQPMVMTMTMTTMKEASYGETLEQYLKVMRILLACGADVGAQVVNHSTAASGAATHWPGDRRSPSPFIRSHDFTQLLLDHGTDIHVQNDKDLEVMQLPVLEEHMQVLSLIIVHNTGLPQGGSV
ncbi:hypothetical protein BC827DRAFT_1242679 [Russula dissimulans]|nr:hypothetical protein BC827DRAFT_1242679 [Russula dissimulans]